MLRAAIAAGTELGGEVKPIFDAGELVPDDLMVALIRERLAQPTRRDGFILDGFPRTIPQAEALDAMLEEIDRELSVVLEFQLADELAFERLLGRAPQEGRSDDTPEIDPPPPEVYQRRRSRSSRTTSRRASSSASTPSGPSTRSSPRWRRSSRRRQAR